MAIPALRKKREIDRARLAPRLYDEILDFKWNHRYTKATIAALMIAIVTTAFGFMNFPIPEDVSLLSFAVAAFVYGVGLEEFTIEAVENIFPTP